MTASDCDSSLMGEEHAADETIHGATMETFVIQPNVAVSRKGADKLVERWNEMVSGFVKDGGTRNESSIEDASPLKR
jgi:hypothetical protein